VDICKVLVALCFLLFGLALKPGLHPVAIAHLSQGTPSSSLLGSQIPTGGSKEVGGEYKNARHFHPMFYRCIMHRRNHFYLVLLQEDPFFYCLDQILVHLLAVLDG
jgi:hypothetical protein